MDCNCISPIMGCSKPIEDILILGGITAFVFFGTLGLVYLYCRST